MKKKYDRGYITDKDLEEWNKAKLRFLQKLMQGKIDIKKGTWK